MHILYISVCVTEYTYMHVLICIYIPLERERDREKWREYSKMLNAEGERSGKNYSKINKLAL